MSTVTLSQSLEDILTYSGDSDHCDVGQHTHHLWASVERLQGAIVAINRLGTGHA